MTGSVLIPDNEPDVGELLEITLDRQYSHMSVAVISADGNTETALRALKAGAFDFVSKPVDLKKLRCLVTSALKLSLQSAQTSPPRVPISRDDSITGNSASVTAMRQQIARVARSQAPVFISGESGSGKELAARAIHRQSPRADGPFIGINCGAMPAELVESELFGHTKGSFTGADKDKAGIFQAAQGGTLFLDEVADLPMNMQVKLLRVIQEKSVRPVGSQTEVNTDVRILSASHRNLLEEVTRGSFRQDLYYRINVLELAVPSLRTRGQDIPELTRQILVRIAEENHIHPVPRPDDEAMRSLVDYQFPGNIRELENLLQRAVTTCEDSVITAQDLGLHHEPASTAAYDLRSPVRSAAEPGDLALHAGFSLEEHLAAIERLAIERALQITRWNKTAAARRLGVTFRCLRYRMKKLGME